MSRLVVVESLRNATATRHEWDVVMDAAHPERGLDPAVLLEKVGAVASSLAKEAIGDGAVATSLDRLEVHGVVSAGERLIITAAVEPSRDGVLPISLVARRRRGSPGAVVLVGVLRFSVAVTDVTADQQNARLLRGGATPMMTSFRARLPREDVLLGGGNLVPWVHASSLVSAQGFAGGPVSLAEVQSLSVLAPVKAGETLTLHCSVVRSSGDKVTVLSLVRSETRDVLAAVTTFKVKNGEAPLLVVG
ncbi:MAG: hypothetical protein DI536_13280 [Archangium gephyra]|uniref:Uncharacterized protein n=1 Tax=Archangium gephyra TaxID=48 RepID=A0A2W5TJ10_9BACT|nr:MAG: hypothetical protein DI536_13280 [Archangium gephyra]